MKEPTSGDYFDSVRMISDVFGEGRTIQVKDVISKRYSTIRRPGYAWPTGHHNSPLYGIIDYRMVLVVLVTVVPSSLYKDIFDGLIHESQASWKGGEN
jgi:hypothetical protein